MASREFYLWIIISYNMEDEIIKAAMDILQPVLESAMILAGHYTKACGRSTMTSLDVKYTMRYAARNLVGKHIGSLFPEDEDEDSESESEIETVEEDEFFLIAYKRLRQMAQIEMHYLTDRARYVCRKPE